MRIDYPTKEQFEGELRGSESGALDFIVLATAPLVDDGPVRMRAILEECVRALKNGGLLFVQGCPEYLPEIGVSLDGRLSFKYWIAVESTPRPSSHGLPSVHAAILLLSKGGAFNVRRTRFPHQTCAFCGKSLRDWGGKSHLMNPDGCVISDVWTELPPEDNYSQISTPVLHTIMRMLGFPKEPRGIIGPAEGIAFLSETKPHPEPPGRSDLREHGAVNPLSDEMLDVVLRGDALKVLRRYPDNCIDLAFADPPYNLNKAYSVYEDGSDEARYVEWCNSWLAEYARVLKPTGSLYVLNLPRWAMYHAAFLNERLCFRNWIVWDALSDPRGKLMPAHYALLHYTKHPTDFTSNYNQVLPIDSRRYCLRASCIRKRKSAGDDEKEPLTDLWWDIHRIKHRRDRDYHPCQLPDALLERIISLSSNEGDIVLDALCGAGTTPVAAAKFGRRYVAIDIDKAYVGVTKWKIEQVRTLGCVPRASTQKQKGVYTKKELQLGLRDLAAKLGRLPTPEDVSRMTDYDVDILLSMFPTWGKALKAAKLIGREVTA